MKLSTFGALMGAVVLFLATPAGAATVTGTSIVNSIGTGNFTVTDLANGAQGINGADFDNGKRYYDYLFSFTLNGSADVTASATATAGTNVLESHVALFSSSPAGTALNVGHNPNPLTTLTDTTGLLTEASLAAGTYFFRVFGVIAGNSDINSHLVALSGNVAATPIPAALPLFATALGLFGFMGWRRKAAGSATA